MNRWAMCAAVLGTSWVALVLAAFFAVGFWIPNLEAAIWYWGFGWMFAGALVACPFVIYATVKEGL